MTEMFGEAWSPMSVPDLAPDDDDDLIPEYSHHDKDWYAYRSRDFACECNPDFIRCAMSLNVQISGIPILIKLTTQGWQSCGHPDDRSRHDSSGLSGEVRSSVCHNNLPCGRWSPL